MQVKKLVTFSLLLISALFLIENVATTNRHSSIFKSIDSTDGECHRYLIGRDGNCSVRCRGLLHRFWTEQSKLSYSAIKQFYQPDPEDKCYLDRTIECLKRVSVLENNCGLVDQYVRCYKDQYGEEDTTAARFIPFTRVQQTRILMECAAILGIPEDSLMQAAMNTSEMPHEACLLRCFLIRQGLYSDAGGFDLERLEVQCGGYGNDWDPVAVRKCFANVTNDDQCSKVQRMTKTCLPVYLKVMPNPNIRTNKFIPAIVEFMGIEVDTRVGSLEARFVNQVMSSNAPISVVGHVLGAHAKSRLKTSIAIDPERSYIPQITVVEDIYQQNEQDSILLLLQ